MRLKIYLLVFLSIILTSCFRTRQAQVSLSSQPIVEVASAPAREVHIRPGAERTRQYFNRLKGYYSVAVVANQTSLIQGTHLVDSLLAEGIMVTTVFTPEHGFRGSADAGALIDNEIDARTGLPIISLYGNNKYPKPNDLKGIDIVVFDLQDVGTRFFTYISTMTYMMEACATLKIPFLVLDRPNPNGFYVDGPILDTRNSSFVGLHPVPVVYGMTMAEYARMVNEEGWLKDSVQCDLDWVECSGYNHRSFYNLPVKPSPNLPDMNSVILYPSLCLFEGTKVSVGRGTDFPFSVIGYPENPEGDFYFTPRSKTGASNPPYKDVQCRGFNLVDSVNNLKEKPGLRLHWLIDMYKADTSKTDFFNSFFIKLAGTNSLQKQIESGMDEKAIKESWKTEQEAFMEKRHKYLLYRDFEKK